MKNKVIVFGNNHLNALGIVRSLGENDINPICVLTGNHRGFVFDSKYPDTCVFQPDVKQGLDFIIHYFENEIEKPIIIPCGDMVVHILDINFNNLSSGFYIHHANEVGKLTSFMNKERVGLLAAKYGLLIPRTWVYKKGNSIPMVTFPCFVKALSSLYAKKKIAEICYSIEELEAVIEKTKCQQLVIQEWIDKMDELCLMGFSINRGEDVCLPYQMNYLQLPSKSFGARVQLTVFKDNDLYNVIKMLIKEIGFVGLFSAEFIIDKKGDRYFTEINFRNDGYSYFSTKGGFSLPYYFCMSLLRKQLVFPNKEIKQKLIGVNELYYYAQCCQSKKISFCRFIKDVLSADALLLGNLKDPKPVFHARVGYYPNN